MAKSGILVLPGIGARPRSHALRLDHVIVDNEPDFAALEPEWEDLFGRARTQTPFLRYSWLRRCWERQRTIHGTSLFIVALREGGRTVLIAPFVTRPCGFWRRELCFLDSLTPQYNDVLVVSGDCGRYLASLWRLLRAMPRIERFAANWVRDDSVLSPGLRDGASKEKAVFEAPFIDLSKFAS